MIEPYSQDKPLPSADDVRKWTCAELVDYSSPLLDEDDKGKLRNSKVSGDEFLDCDANDFYKMGLPVGPVKKLLKLVKRINRDTGDSPAPKRQKSAPDEVKYSEKIIKRFKPSSRVHEGYRPYFYYADQTKNNSSLIDAIVHGSYICMYGPRASGKSSRTIEAMKTLGSMGYKCFYVDLQTVPRSNKEAFWSEIGKQVELSNEIDSRDGFLRGFARSKDSPRNKVIFFDEFDVLLHDELEGILSPLLSALRGARDNVARYTIHSVISIGTFAITRLVQKDFKFSPFSSMEGFSGKSLTEEQVKDLFQEFAADRRITIDSQVVDDIYQLTNGHAAMVNICGAAIDDALPPKGQTYDLPRWQNLTTSVLEEVLAYGTFYTLVEILKKQKDAVNCVRLQFLGNFDQFISPVDIGQARFLAAQGVLTPNWAGSRFKMSSPMIDSLVRKCVIPTVYPLCPTVPVPTKSNGELDCLETLKEAVKVFDKDLMKRAAINALKTVPVKVNGHNGELVPRESVYNSELMRILSNWLGQASYRVTGHWHHIVGNSHKYSDIVMDNGAYKFVLEVLATGDKGFMEEHIERAKLYKDNMGAEEAWVIHFTCEDDYLGHPQWQSDELLDASINVVHIHHDRQFTNVTMSARVKSCEMIEKECIISQ